MNRAGAETPGFRLAVVYTALVLAGATPVALAEDSGRDSLSSPVLVTPQLTIEQRIPLSDNGAVASLPDGRVAIVRRFAPDTAPQSISFVDPSTVPAQVETVPLQEAGMPTDIAVDPAGRRIYVGISEYLGSRRTPGRNRVDIIDILATPPHFVGSAISPTGDAFGTAKIAVAPSGDRVYVTNRGDGVLDILEADVNTDSYSFSARVPTGGAANSVAVSANGQRVFVVNRSRLRAPGRGASSFAEIDPWSAPPTRVARIDLSVGAGGAATTIVLTPAGDRAYVAVQGSPQVTPPWLSSRIAIIDTTTVQEIGTLIDLSNETAVPGEIQMQNMLLGSNGQLLYIGATNDTGNHLYLVDLSSPATPVRQRLPLAGAPFSGLRIAATPSHSNLYVQNFDELLQISSGTVAAITTVGDVGLIVLAVGLLVAGLHRVARSH